VWLLKNDANRRNEFLLALVPSNENGSTVAQLKKIQDHTTRESITFRRRSNTIHTRHGIKANAGSFFVPCNALSDGIYFVT
jgi:hypothetical protein